MIFSIIMPVYNAEKILARSIESALKQTLKDFEIIIVDDGSIDNSWNIIKKYESNDKRVIALHQDNAGPGAAFAPTPFAAHPRYAGQIRFSR